MSEKKQDPAHCPPPATQNAGAGCDPSTDPSCGLDQAQCEQFKKALDDPGCREFVKQQCEQAVQAQQKAQAGAAGGMNFVFIANLILDAVKKWLDTLQTG